MLSFSYMLLYFTALGVKGNQIKVSILGANYEKDYEKGWYIVATKNERTPNGCAKPDI